VFRRQWIQRALPAVLRIGELECLIVAPVGLLGREHDQIPYSNDFLSTLSSLYLDKNPEGGKHWKTI
jgi:hypothetical protein